MGQTTFAIMYAVDVSELIITEDEETDDETRDIVYDAAGNYKKASCRLADELLGIEVAVGGSGRYGEHEKHVADFNYITCEFSEAGLRSDKEINKAIDRAMRQWPAFVRHMKKHGKIDISSITPQLMLTNTETA